MQVTACHGTRLHLRPMWLTQPFSAPVRFAAPTRRAGRAAPVVLTNIIARTSADVSTPTRRNAARVADDLHTRSGPPMSHRHVATAIGRGGMQVSGDDRDHGDR